MLFKKILKILPVILYSIFVFYISAIPITQKPSIQHLDKVVHLLIYGVLSLLLVFAFRKKTWITATLISGGYGFINEIHQIFVPGRSFSIADILFNFIGAFLFAIAYMKIINKHQIEKKL